MPWLRPPFPPFETEEVRSLDFYDDAAKVWRQPAALVHTSSPPARRIRPAPPACPTPPAHLRHSCAFSSDLLAHPGLTHVRRQSQVALGLPLLHGQVCLVPTDGGGRTCPALYRVESQPTVSISTQSVVFHTLARIESIVIGSFAKAGQPQAMPPTFGVFPSRRHLCRKGVVTFTIPLPCWRPWFPLPQGAPRT